MKIFFYKPSEYVEEVHGDYRRHKLQPYLKYLEALRDALQRFATRDADEADYFFVPMSLISFQFQGRKGRFRDPRPYIDSLRYLGRKPHLLFAGGDFGQRRHAAYETQVPWRPYPRIYDWLDERFMLLAFESTNDLLPQDIALFPYVLTPDSIAARARERLLRRTPRDLLYSFAGAVAYGELSPDHIRGGRLRELAGATQDSFVGSLAEARRRYGPMLSSDVGMLRRSVFTLCPAGFGRWSFRFVQAATYGSIPVLLSDGYVKPFARHIDWDRFSLTVPEAAVRGLPDLLRSFSPADIARYQRGLVEYGPKLTGPSMHAMLAEELDRRLR